MRTKLHLNQDFLKIVGLLAMTLDHLSKQLFVPQNEAMILVGRIAFPIFAYLLMGHLYQKQCFDKYIRRLFFFGLITQGIIFYFGASQKNVLFAFLLPVVFLKIVPYVNHLMPTKSLRAYMYVAIFLFFGALSFLVDYYIVGFCFLLSLYGWFKYKTSLFLGLIFTTCCLLNFDVLQAIISTLTLSILLLNQPLKNHKRLLKNKYVFYIFYPTHLAIISLLKTLGVVF